MRLGLVGLFFLQISVIIADDKIERINLPNIPSKNLLSVTSDGSNFIWVGTDQGLVRYDGIDIDIFRSNPFSPSSLSGNRVWFLDNYNSDTLIVVTDNAVHLYSKKNYEFERYIIDSRPTNYFKFGNEIWITTLSDGVYKLNKNKELIRFRFEPLDPFSISSSNFESINGSKFALDSNSNIWLATSSGLNKIKKDNSVRRYFRSNTDNELLSDNILSLYFLDSGTLLIGTDRGLNYYDIKNELFPKGLNSLMYQLNLLINKRLSNEKKPLRFKSFRVNEKVKYFTMRRLMIFESLVDKKYCFMKLLTSFSHLEFFAPWMILL